MSRLRRFGWALAIIAGVGLLGSLSAYLVVTRTEWGREKFITWAIDAANGTLGGRGKIRVGVLYQLNGDGIRAGDVSIVDTTNAVVLHVNELRGAISYTALLNRQIHIPRLELRGVRLELKRDFTGPWNIAHIITGGPPKPPSAVPGFGDDIRIDAIVLDSGTIAMQYPWAPNDVFKGRARDSVIALRKSAHDVTQLPQGLIERRLIALPRLIAHDAIIASPGDDPSSIQVDSLRGTISDPPVRIVQTSGGLRWTPDSMMLDLPNVVLPASVASAKGSVRWNEPGAVRYDVNVEAKAGLSDLTWIWDVLPDSGTGTANVRLRTLEDADDAEYTLSKLNVDAMRSKITGDITVVVRPDQMLLKDVDLQFAPMRSELLNRISYDAVPKEIQGAIQGRLVSRAGGPLTALQIDRLDATFLDDKVPGARSMISASGLVGLGANPTARNVRVANVLVDLRTVRNIAPETPPVDGIVRGSMMIASADLKHANVSSLDVNWTDADGNASHVTGNADVRFGDKVPVINTELLLDPVALKAIARIDTLFPITSPLRGTVSASGRLDSLRWTASLANGNGKVEGQGLASLRDSVWMVQAKTDVAAFDIRNWLGRTDVPQTNINGTASFRVGAELRSDSTTHITDATFDVGLRQAAADSMPEFAARGTGYLDAARLRIDSASVLLGGIKVDLVGALARDSAATDTLTASLEADSLGAARPELIRLAAMLQPVDTVLAKSLRSYAADTLQGDVSGSAVMVGSLPAFSANVSLSARRVEVGALDVRRVFGSVRATGLPDNAHFDATASIDDITGIGQVKFQNAEFRIEDASPDSGRLRLDVVARDTTGLRIRGDFSRVNDVLSVRMDTVRFNYGDAVWINEQRSTLVSDERGIRVDTLLVRSNQRGLLQLAADVPVDGDISALLRVERFPAGEIATFATSSPTKYSGLLTGETRLSGTRLAPRIVWNMIGDSVGTARFSAPPLVTDGQYQDKRMVAHVVLEDSVRSRLRFEARVPIDLSMQSVEKRLLSDVVDAEIVADTLQLSGLPINVEGVSRLQGTLLGRIALGGTIDRPVATGRMVLDGFSASADILGITPRDGQMVLVAAEDQLTLERLRFRSGERVVDTVGMTGVLRFPAEQPMTVEAKAVASNALLMNQRDGMQVNLSGEITAKGPLKRPDVTASLFVPRATIVADPLNARSALDLNSAQARELLGAAEIPVASSFVDPLANIGNYVNITDASITMGDGVWVQTPEARVRLTGSLDIKTTPNGLLGLDGEVSADRGTFRLEHGPVVARTFTVDSGKVRFYGTDAIPPQVDIHATHIVRVSGDGGSRTETPIHVTISGTFDNLALKLSSDDEVFGGAPDSEIISLLMFGAPSFALNDASRGTLKAATNVLSSSVGSLVEGQLQGLLGFNTVQLSTATGDELALRSLLDLNLGLGRQIGDRTFLRLNTALCRPSDSAASAIQLNAGLSVEYRIRKTILAQAGVDQGSSSCTTVGQDGRRILQFGFDLFREWVF
ncbi:MAG: translocation/assembly module TamB domain-containing protein [Gemmatimonas sp.]